MSQLRPPAAGDRHHGEGIDQAEPIAALADFRAKGMDEELRADVPEVLQQRVRNMLSNWGQQSDVSLPTDARSHLDSAIVGLLQDSLRAFAPASGGQ